MKVIVASFQCESNSKTKMHPDKGDFEYFTGEDIFKKLANIAEESDDGYSILFERLLKAFPEAAPNNGEISEKNMANKMFA